MVTITYMNDEYGIRVKKIHFDGTEKSAGILSTILTQYSDKKGFFGNRCCAVYKTVPFSKFLLENKARQGRDPGEPRRIYEGYIKINGHPVYKGQDIILYPESHDYLIKVDGHCLLPQRKI